MQRRKCADSDGISAKHFSNAPVNVLIRLTHLFNTMLKHAFVPRQFQIGDLIPILKDQLGNHADTDNYGGITISPQASKILEHALKDIFCDNFMTSPVNSDLRSEARQLMHSTV